MKQRIVNYLLRYLLNAITVDEIVSQDSRTKLVTLDGKVLLPDEVRQLQAEIKALEGFRIWRILTNTVKHAAEDTIFNKSTNIEDIRFGKAVLYAVSLQDSIIRVLREKKIVSTKDSVV